MSDARIDPLSVASVERAFSVLEAFDAKNPTMSLTQLASATGLTVSAAQRFAYTLVKLGYLQKNQKTKRFELTPKNLGFGYHYIKSNPLISVAMPYMLHLSNETEETISLTQLDGTMVVYIGRVMSRHVLSIDTIVGSRLPAYCTSSGVAILSKLAPERALAIIEASDLVQYTPNTTCTRHALLKKIEHSKEVGYATSFGEFYFGDLSLAAAIQDGSRQPIGAINIGVSESRYSPAEVERRFSALIVAAAASISQANSSEAA